MHSFPSITKSVGKRLVTDKGEMLNIFVKLIGAAKKVLIIFGTSPQMESCFGLIPK